MKQAEDSLPRRTSGRMTPKMKRLSTITQETTAILSEMNLKTFITLIMMQIAIRSERTQFLDENHHANVKKRPITRLIKSTTRTLSFASRYSLRRKVCLKNRNRIYSDTIPTDKGLTIQLTTFRKIAAAAGAQRVIIPTPKIIAEIKRIQRKLYSIPDPPNDYSLAKTVAKISTTVAHPEIMNCPHSKFVGLNSSLQFSSQEKVPMFVIES